MFSFGGKKPDQDTSAAIIDATNTEAGITALGGLDVSAADTIAQSPKSLSEAQKDAVSQLFSDNDDDYLVLPGASKQRPRSAVFTHTIGMAVCVGGLAGGGYGLLSNFTPKLTTSSIERSQYLTSIIRMIRNNAIRCGHFATVMCTGGILLELMNREKLPDQPTEEELFEMQMKGIPYQPPVQPPIDEKTQQNITTAGFISAAVLVALPKSLELWTRAKKFESLQHARAESGVIEQQVLRFYGRKSTVDNTKLPTLLRRLAVGKMVGVLGVAVALDFMWRKQMKDKVNKTIRSFSSSVY